MRLVKNAIAIAIALAAAVPAIGAAQGRQYIDIGSPDFHPLPIAVAPFKGEGDVQAANEVNQTLREDLIISGLFEVLDPKSFLADPREGLGAPSIKFSRWADVGADGLVKAVIRKNGGQLHADFRLYEVRAGREVLNKSYTEGAANMRSLAHRFADDIVQHYTKEPGIFRTRIAFIRKNKRARDLLVSDVDGRNVQVVYQDGGINLLPAWNNSGNELLFTSYRGGRPELWIVRLGDRSVRKLISTGELATGGTFSPDGRRIALSLSQDGNADIWVVGTDGTGMKQLTRDPATDTSPSWSPDGRKIAFVSSRSGNPQIYLMDADGSDQKRLTFQGNYNQTPRWSPRGDLIAFTARDERNVFDIFTVAPESGKIQRVTQDQGSDNEEPSWAPNGRLLVFTSNRNGRPQLVISTPSGDKQRVVTREAGELVNPAWGPLPSR
jgi:TolB protein